MAKKIYDAETQFLVVCFAKDLGLDHLGFINQFDPQETNCSELRLHPILIYAIVVPAYSKLFRILVDARKPVPVSEFLSKAWSSQVDIGAPLTLEVKASLLATDLGYLDWTSALGVKVVPPTSIKSLAAFERSACDVRHCLNWGRWDSDRREDRSLGTANDSLIERDSFRAYLGLERAMENCNLNAWMAREKRFVTAAAVPNDWGLTGITEPAKTKRKVNPQLQIHGDERLEIVDGIDDVIALWPKGPAKLLKALGIKSQDYEFWIRYRAHLHEGDFSRLRALLDVCRDDSDEWEMGAGYLLIATTRSRTAAAYEVLSHGGDLRFSFEIIGPQGELLASRFLVFASNGGFATIILFERSQPAAQLLDKKKLINMQAPVRATPAVWDTVKFVVEHQLELALPEKIGLAFHHKHWDWLEAQNQGFDLWNQGLNH